MPLDPIYYERYGNMPQLTEAQSNVALSDYGMNDGDPLPPIPIRRPDVSAGVTRRLVPTYLHFDVLTTQLRWKRFRTWHYDQQHIHDPNEDRVKNVWIKLYSFEISMFSWYLDFLTVEYKSEEEKMISKAESLVAHIKDVQTMQELVARVEEHFADELDERLATNPSSVPAPIRRKWVERHNQQGENVANIFTEQLRDLTDKSLGWSNNIVMRTIVKIGQEASNPSASGEISCDDEQRSKEAWIDAVIYAIAPTANTLRKDLRSIVIEGMLMLRQTFELLNAGVTKETTSGANATSGQAGAPGSPHADSRTGYDEPPAYQGKEFGNLAESFYDGAVSHVTTATGADLSAISETASNNALIVAANATSPHPTAEYLGTASDSESEGTLRAASDKFSDAADNSQVSESLSEIAAVPSTTTKQVVAPTPPENEASIAEVARSTTKATRLSENGETMIGEGAITLRHRRLTTISTTKRCDSAKHVAVWLSKPVPSSSRKRSP